MFEKGHWSDAREAAAAAAASDFSSLAHKKFVSCYFWQKIFTIYGAKSYIASHLLTHFSHQEFPNDSPA